MKSRLRHSGGCSIALETATTATALPAPTAPPPLPAQRSRPSCSPDPDGDPQMKIAGRGGPLPEASFYGRLQTVLSKDAVI